MENVPFADTIFTRTGSAANRPFLLIEPPYRINNDDKMKAQGRPVRTNEEQDAKVAGTQTSDSKVDAKVGTGPSSDSKTDVKVGTTPMSDSKAETMVAATSIPDSKVDGKVAIVSSSDSKADPKVAAMSVSSESKMQSSASDGSPQTNPDKQAKKASPGGARQKSSKVANMPMATTSHSQQDGERPPVTPPQISRPALEDNIVLGVALEGSKRTLPIEEGMDSSPTSAEAKELAACRNGNGSSSTGSDKEEGQIRAAPGATAGDQRDQGR
nr:TPA_asm: hypothetical protein HUJ06_015269 [Nelumbo nucifera]